MDLTSLHGYVSGRVQGVGFRAFVRRQAKSFHVTGWARNLPDTRVEFTLSGSKENVAAVYAAIHEGPTFSAVETVESETVEFEKFSDFTTG